jgi:hypothetical protein
MGRLKNYSPKLTFSYIPERDALRGPTQGDNLRHSIVRRAFMAEMIHDERLRSLFQSWLTRSGMADSINRIEAALCAAEVVDDRVDMTEEFERYVAAFAAFQEGSGEHIEYIAREAVEFSTSLGLDWGWLPLEIHIEFVLALWRKWLDVLWRCGLTDELLLIRNFEVVPPPIQQDERLTVTVQMRPGETVDDIRRRLVDEIEKLTDKIGPVVPRGTIPNKTGALQKYARWFYEHRVRGRSVRSIARELWPEEDRRADVTRGIAQAQKFLGYGAYTLATTGEKAERTSSPVVKVQDGHLQHGEFPT